MKNKETKNTIHNPHDAAFLGALSNHKVARDVMRSFLPSEILEQADLAHIKKYPTKLLSPEYKRFEADIIYQVPLKNQIGLILLHIEHQSTVDPDLPLRIWQYLLLVLMEFAENNPGKPLPVIYPIIIYSGEKPYTASTDFFDLFGEQKDLAKQYLLSPFRLVDVCRMKDEDIKNHKIFGLLEFAYKYRNTLHFRRFLKEYMPWLREIELHVSKKYATISLRYVVDTFTNSSYEEFAEEAKKHLSNELGEKAVTIAQQLEQRGAQQQKHIIASNLLLMNTMKFDEIAKATNMTVEELKELAKKLKTTKH